MGANDSGTVPVLVYRLEYFIDTLLVIRQSETSRDADRGEFRFFCREYSETLGADAQSADVLVVVGLAKACEGSDLTAEDDRFLISQLPQEDVREGLHSEC